MTRGIGPAELGWLGAAAMVLGLVLLPLSVLTPTLWGAPAGPLRPELMVVPAGWSRIGTDGALLLAGAGDGDEQTAGRFVQSFAIGRTEVTVGMYRRVRGNGLPTLAQFAPWGSESLPVTGITWLDAIEYCNGLSKLANIEPAYVVSGGEVTVNTRGLGYRLPTEFEWEYVVRAGSTTKFWSGDDEAGLDRSDWIAANSGGEVHSVATKKPNPWGLFDVGGNAKEWVWDPYCDRDIWKNCDPSARTARGGSFSEPAREARSANRCGDWAGFRCANVGIRVAQSIVVP